MSVSRRRQRFETMRYMMTSSTPETFDEDKWTEWAESFFDGWASDPRASASLKELAWAVAFGVTIDRYTAEHQDQNSRGRRSSVLDRAFSYLGVPHDRRIVQPARPGYVTASVRWN